MAVHSATVLAFEHAANEALFVAGKIGQLCSRKTIDVVDR